MKLKFKELLKHQSSGPSEISGRCGQANQPGEKYSQDGSNDIDNLILIAMN